MDKVDAIDEQWQVHESDLCYVNLESQCCSMMHQLEWFVFLFNCVGDKND